MNSVGITLDLTRGQLSKAMLSAAGKEIQDELKRVGPQKAYAKPGSVYLTKGYGLKCKYVLHAIGFSKKDGEEISVQVS